MSKVLTIQRSKWRRGGENYDESHGDTYLLNANGNMCCLGFDAVACGLTRQDIFERTSPMGVAEGQVVPDDYISQRLDGYGDNLPAVRYAMEHNDDSEIDDQARERLVREDLIALGWDDVVFVD